jgi:hypothetical protein
MNRAITRVGSRVLQRPSWTRTLPRYSCPQPTFALFSSTQDEDLGNNPGLASVISQGISSLDNTAADVQQKTRKASLENKRSKAPNPRQLAEAERILEVAGECLEDLCMRGEAGGLSLKEEPIVILDVQVNRPVKQAKVFWTLPYVVLMDERMTRQVYKRLMGSVEEQMIKERSGKLLARQVHARLRSYYPPRLKLLPATDDMVERALAEYLEE